LPIGEDVEQDTAVDKPKHVMARDLDVGEIRFSREAVARTGDHNCR